MPTITAIINQKGGVGKSTTAHAMGAGLALRGRRVLFVDMDAQCNLTYSLGADTGGTTLLTVLTRGTKLKDAILHLPGGDLLPGDPGLSGMDMSLTETGKEYRLKEALETVGNDYDDIILDTPPALGILTVNALTAATGIVIPSQADIYSLQGIGQLYSTITAVRRYCNPGLVIEGILLTRYTPRAILSRDIAQMIEQTAQQLDTVVFATHIREGIAVKEAQANRQSIFDYAPKSNAALDYEAFVGELLGRREAP